MRASRLIIPSAAILAAAAILSLVEWRRLRKLEEGRKVVYRETRSMDWWNHDLSETENERRQTLRIREMHRLIVPVLTRDLYSREGSAWFDKVPILGQLLPRASDSEEPENSRVNAAHWLGMIGTPGASAVPDLVEVLANDTPRVRATAAFALGQIGVATPEVIQALANATAHTNPGLAVSAAIAVWQLTSKQEDFDRASRLIIQSPSWAAITLGRVEKPAREFAPALLGVRDALPWGHARMQVIEAHWKITGEKPAVLEMLGQLESELAQGSATTNQVTGWTTAEECLGYAAHRLDTEPEFRAVMRPLLQKLGRHPASPASAMARTYYEKHFKLDRTEKPEPAPPPSTE